MATILPNVNYSELSSTLFGRLVAGVRCSNRLPVPNDHEHLAATDDYYAESVSALGDRTIGLIQKLLTTSGSCRGASVLSLRDPSDQLDVVVDAVDNIFEKLDCALDDARGANANRVGLVLLTNCHTCLYGSQTGDYFSLHPPALEVYLL
eukprot:gnl/Spiro4/22556_TR11125_c0_g1_i1.p1 gnl/Spiro4/22556_TR11125_c0_g1~~gnl/Spiro4/22556_TR11125_c0_g1_i1.p1  ORF type:complete len:160 (-),score=19.62 gnl/Spiro4/22556_TR11125_c0_g1_i1:29-478(-)